MCKPKIEILDRLDFNKECNKDTSIQKRIRFFNLPSWRDENSYYIVLKIRNKVIGVVALISYKNEPADITISYFSIDRKYRGKGYTNLLSDGVMKLCKEHNYSLSSSSWTFVGNIKLRPNIKKHALLNNIEFVDNDRKFDNEYQYDKNFIHVSEMTEKELNKYNETV